MPFDRASPASRPVVRLRVLCGGLLAAAVLTACSLAGRASTAIAPPARAADCTAVAFAAPTDGAGSAPSSPQPIGPARGSATPLGQLRHAILLSQPRSAELPNARVLLDAVLAADTVEAVQLHPLARLLAAQLAERQRLEAETGRLAQQLERTGQQLKDSRRQAEALQDKLDALAAIEDKLPARVQAPPPPEIPDRRSP